MRKLTKKITAMVTALVLTGAMVISSSAASYGLYYTVGAPSSAVRLRQDFLSTATRAQTYTISNRLNTFGGEELTSYGMVKSGATYYCVAMIKQTSTGYKTKTGTYYRVGKGAPARNDVVLDKGSENSTKAYGIVSGY